MLPVSSRGLFINMCGVCSKDLVLEKSLIFQLNCKFVPPQSLCSSILESSSVPLASLRESLEYELAFSHDTSCLDFYEHLTELEMLLWQSVYIVVF